MFRQQEHWAEGLVARRVEQTKLRRGDFKARPIARQIAKPAPGRPLPAQLTVDLENAALHRFYTEYAYTSGTCPFLYLVAPLYEASSTPACLHNAVHAISLGTMARQARRYEVMERAQNWYGKALNSLVAALDHSEDAKHDGTLLAVALLGLYEVGSKMDCSKTLTDVVITSFHHLIIRRPHADTHPRPSSSAALRERTS